MPGRDGPENLRILKKSRLKVKIGPRRQRVEFLPLRRELGIRPLSRRVEFFESLPTEILNITRCAERWGWLA